jgi:sugar/nucleoside kinase (ribokinase family)
VVKVGQEGSMVKSGDNVFHIPAIEADVVDTNGAGDIYAAGFLHGLSQGWPLDKCAMCGGILAGKIIEITGARLTEEGWQKALEMIKRL